MPGTGAASASPRTTAARCAGAHPRVAVLTGSEAAESSGPSWVDDVDVAHESSQSQESATNLGLEWEFAVGRAPRGRHRPAIQRGTRCHPNAAQAGPATG